MTIEDYLRSDSEELIRIGYHLLKQEDMYVSDMMQVMIKCGFDSVYRPSTNYQKEGISYWKIAEWDNREEYMHQLRIEV